MKDTPPAPEASAELQAATTLVAYVDADGKDEHVRRVAMDAAERNHGRLILYALDAYQPLADPLPTDWSGDREPDAFSDPLTPADLERLGRQELATKVEEAMARGIEAGAWLPREGGVDAMVEFARAHGADVVLLPDEIRDASLLDRLTGGTSDEAAKQDRGPMTVLLVRADGNVTHAAAERAADDS